MRSFLLDTETTGLTLPSVSDLEKQPRIIELGICIVQDGVMLDQYSQLINPGVPISAEITKITGITNEMLAGQPSFAEVVDLVAALAEGCDLFVAHNAPFDHALLEFELRHLGEEVVAEFPWPAEIMCSAQEFTHEFGFRPKLTQLYEAKMGKPLEQTHRALDDIKAVAEVLIKEGLI